MEVNISHRCRQEILTTSDLADPNLFNNALNELIQLIKMVNISIALLTFIFHSFQFHNISVFCPVIFLEEFGKRFLVINVLSEAKRRNKYEIKWARP